jgi:hypothetical protein
MQYHNKRNPPTEALPGKQEQYLDSSNKNFLVKELKSKADGTYQTGLFDYLGNE